MQYWLDERKCLKTQQNLNGAPLYTKDKGS